MDARLRLTWIVPVLAIMTSFSAGAKAQQISISRIEQMPNIPSPYLMRNWRQVAIGYDTFVFDFDKVGQYLPLVWLNTSTVNYPEHDSFGLETVVGTPRQNSGEAINVLPALVGATLVGIDKSDQGGYNWVLMAEEYYNRRPEENVYLNLPITSSGDDWWYETMPNVFFYQLYDLYPGTGHFEEQFLTVADRFLTAVEKMGGKATPWTVPNMNYRAWSFSEMKPLLTGVREPEAAGAIAWLLYNAFTETGDERYRRGAEWAMEFLNTRASNPSYELQLPYGVYAAARMNAELGTVYDVEKMVNWTFDVGPLRSWGSLLGTWGGYDIHGLIGEESSNDYAFMMNGFQQAAALVPMTRYDDRFARAIGKWVLNLANATRLFYPQYLPAINQDSEEWAFQYDPESVIGHEAIRQSQSGQSPYATGDAVAGGWGYTNLVLYGSSHVGMLGGIVDTTDVEGILRLDLLKTDFFGREAFPTYLYYNPHEEARQVTVDLEGAAFDLFDAVSNQFVANGVADATQITIPPEEAVMLVLVPAGGLVTHEGNRTLVNGVVVDYGAGLSGENTPPRIKAVDAAPRDVFRGGTATLYCTAQDRDDDELAFAWSASGGEISGEGATVVWTPPSEVGEYQIACSVSDGQGGSDEASTGLTVFSNHLPQIAAVSLDDDIVDVGGATSATCDASDEDGDLLTYAWLADAGAITGEGSTVSWTAPASPGYYVLRCMVTDGEGGAATDSAGVVAGDLVASYPFDGDARDESGFGNHAMVVGAVLVEDRSGIPSAAYAFDGTDDALVVPGHPSLDFRREITIALWTQAYELFDREAFLVSHGSWQNRWKISVTPEHRLRWTIKTVSQVRDVDAVTTLQVDSVYSVVATYDGSKMKIYVDGILDGEVSSSGLMATTTIDLTIGQMLPGNTEWNYKGVIDDVRIYNRALAESEVRELVGVGTSVDGLSGDRLRHTALLPSFPNPFRGATNMGFELARSADVTMEVFDVMGRKVHRVLAGRYSEGRHRVTWDGKDDGGRSVAAGLYFVRLQHGDAVEVEQIIRVVSP